MPAFTEIICCGTKKLNFWKLEQKARVDQIPSVPLKVLRVLYQINKQTSSVFKDGKKYIYFFIYTYKQNEK